MTGMISAMTERLATLLINHLPSSATLLPFTPRRGTLGIQNLATSPEVLLLRNKALQRLPPMAMSIGAPNATILRI